MIPLGSQLNNFKNVEKMLKDKLGDAETKRIISRAVYLIQIGPNDYFYPFSINASHFESNSKDKFVDYVIGNTTTVIEVFISIYIWTNYNSIQSSFHYATLVTNPVL